MNKNLVEAIFRQMGKDIPISQHRKTLELLNKHGLANCGIDCNFLMYHETVAFFHANRFQLLDLINLESMKEEITSNDLIGRSKHIDGCLTDSLVDAALTNTDDKNHYQVCNAITIFALEQLAYELC